MAVSVDEAIQPDRTFVAILYVAPSLILHYIDAHGYAPPDQFQRAVMECPPMKSMPYLRALLANGGRGIVKAIGNARE